MQFLVQGEIGGVGLDVFGNEPGVLKELFQLDNVVLSPRCAVSTPECFDALGELIVYNLKAFSSNKPLQSLVSLDWRGYTIHSCKGFTKNHHLMLRY